MEPSQQIDPLLGRVLAGKLEILQLLGTGAMGKVYRAHHQGLDKAVAIKVLQKLPGSQGQHAARFKAEARAASRLDHPNSVQILDFGEDDDGLLYIAMEFLEGEDLQTVLQRERCLDSSRTCLVIAQVCAALSAAHQKAVIHRDMKPGNIMLVQRPNEDGRSSEFVKVCDFGLAKIVDLDAELSSGPLTKAGAVFGTPAYMSPEQARGDILDTRTDIYSCGVVMYKMLAGSTPFQAESATGVLMKHITEQPPPLRSFVKNIHPQLEAIVLRAMQKDRDKRYQDARDMRNALREMLREFGEEAALPNISYTQPLQPIGEPTEVASMTPATLPTLVPAQRSLDHATQKQTAPTIEKLEPRTLQTLAIPEASNASVLAPTRISTTWLAAIPGAIALLLIVGLALYVVRDPAPVEKVVVADPQPPPAKTTPPPEPQKVEPEPKPVALETKEVVAPEIESPKSKRNERRKKKEKIEEPEIKPTEPPPPPAKIEEKVVAPPVVEKAAPPPVVEETKPEPAGPRKLGANFSLEVDIVAQKIVGAFSKMRAQDALLRYRDDAERCVRDAVRRAGVETEDHIEVSANIELSGALRDMKVTSPIPGVDACVQKTFSATRLKRPDTGDGSIVFHINYRAKAGG